MGHLQRVFTNPVNELVDPQNVWDDGTLTRICWPFQPRWIQSISQNVLWTLKTDEHGKCGTRWLTDFQHGGFPCWVHANSAPPFRNPYGSGSFISTSWLFNIAMGKSPFLIGEPSINGPFSMAMLNNQMVCQKSSCIIMYLIKSLAGRASQPSCCSQPEPWMPFPP